MRERANKSLAVPANIGPGTVLSGRFRLVEPIGSGGMAVVWHAEHLDLGISVALKMLRPVDAHSSVARARFEKEARTVAALKHPNVVQILEYGVHEHVPYLAMELLEGETLARRLDRRGKLDAITVVWLVEQVARPLDKAHAKGIIHRDIKPDNIFLQATDEGEVVKLVDFGIAKIIDGDKQDALTKTDAVIGTTHYLSPERTRGRKPLDGRVDLWALAVVVYECLVGQRPFDEHADDLLGLLRAIAEVDYPPPSLMVPTPPELDAWMDRALNPNPDRRMASASEMASELRDALLPGTVSSPTGMAIEALETEMLPYAEEHTPSREQEPTAQSETLPRYTGPRPVPVAVLPPTPLPLPAIERAVRSGPQLRRADLSFEPISYEVEASIDSTEYAEVEGMPSFDPEPGPTDSVTLAMDTPGIPTRPLAQEPPPYVAQESPAQGLPPLESAPLPTAAIAPATSSRWDWRLVMAAAASMFLAAGFGVVLMQWLSAQPPMASAAVASADPLPTVSTTRVSHDAAPAIPVSALPPAFSVAPPVLDVERLPVPDSEPPSPSSTHVRPPRHNAGRGTGRKPHEVFGL